jgi:hypothetical protein
MAPSLASIRETWTATTDHDSVWIKLGVIVTASVVWFVITWNVVGIWERLFGNPSLVTYPVALSVYLALYFYSVARRANPRVTTHDGSACRWERTV